MEREYTHIFIESGLADVLDAPLPRFKHRIRKTTDTDAQGAVHCTLELPAPLFLNFDLQADAIGAVAGVLKQYLKKYGIKKTDAVLVAGIGNAGMTADALGARTLQYLEVTEHFYREGVQEKGKGRLACVAGSVSGVTGLRSFDIVKGVTERVKPALIIAVDTLASRKPARLQRVIQLSDNGITPGAGVQNAKEPLAFDTLGVPVIAIGVPLVIYARNIVADYLEENGVSAGKGNMKEELRTLIVTLKEIDAVVEDFARVIGRGINAAVH